MDKIQEISKHILALYDLWKGYDEKKKIASILQKMPKPKPQPSQNWNIDSSWICERIIQVTQLQLSKFHVFQFISAFVIFVFWNKKV